MANLTDRDVKNGHRVIEVQAAADACFFDDVAKAVRSYAKFKRITIPEDDIMALFEQRRRDALVAIAEFMILMRAINWTDPVQCRSYFEKHNEGINNRLNDDAETRSISELHKASFKPRQLETLIQTCVHVGKLSGTKTELARLMADLINENSAIWMLDKLRFFGFFTSTPDYSGGAQGNRYILTSQGKLENIYLCSRVMIYNSLRE